MQVRYVDKKSYNFQIAEQCKAYDQVNKSQREADELIAKELVPTVHRILSKTYLI